MQAWLTESVVKLGSSELAKLLPKKSRILSAILEIRCLGPRFAQLGQTARQPEPTKRESGVGADMRAVDAEVRQLALGSQPM